MQNSSASSGEKSAADDSDTIEKLQVNPNMTLEQDCFSLGNISMELMKCSYYWYSKRYTPRCINASIYQTTR